ncbi:MAG: alpha/beta fold hydrolase [Myxococcota bacterium]|nr:alpha/beta fold hydrolase [Myxococcota bacterium]
MSDHLHVELDGNPERPPLLLLHGFLSSNVQWSLNREGLGRHFRLALAEIWGHGKSPAPREPGAYRVERYVEEMEHIRRSLDAERWLVCGQSFGAGIAIRYALAHPEATRGLIVTNSRSAFNDVSQEARGSGDPAVWECIDLRSLPQHPCHARRFPPTLKAEMEVAADAVDRFALWHAGATTAAELSCRQVAADIAVPTLLVNGRFEKSFQADREFAAATVPGIEVVDLDAGHSVNIEAAEGFDGAVADFARRNP